MTIRTNLYSPIGAGVLALFAGVHAVQAEPIVYVPLGSEGNIIAVDAASDQIIGTLAGIEAVHGLAGTPDGRFLIAGSYSERSADGTPAKPEGVSEDEHAAHHKAPSNTPEKTAEGSLSTVSVIRIADQKIIRVIDVPGAVHHVAVGPKGRYASVTHPNEGRISVIDLSTYKIVANIVTGSFPNYSLFDADGARLYVSNAGDNALAVVNAESWAVETIIAVGTSPEHIVLSKDGTALYVNNVDDGTVSVVDTGDGRVSSTIQIGSTLHGIDLSEDGKTLFVASLGDDKVVQVDLSIETTKAVKLSPAPYHLATIPGTGKLYVSSADEPKIWVLDEERLKIVGQITIGGKGHQMVPIPGS